MDRKLNRGTSQRPSRKRKRKFSGNRFTTEKDVGFTSTSASKMKSNLDEEFTIDDRHGYRILNFFAVFSMISEYVVCRECKNDIAFNESAVRGIGFKIVLQCDCRTKFIESSPTIGKAYEINRRLVFAMRLLGVSLKGLNLFCGVMDLCLGISSSMYYTVLENIHCAAQTLLDRATKHAVSEEVQKSEQAGNPTRELTVSGDGTWKKRGFSSAYGVSSLIGHYSNKILDVVVKSSYCKACEIWEPKKGTVEYDDWYESHEEECLLNHSGSAAKMEVDAITEMFERSEEKYGVKYINYIGDGDTKTFKAICELRPYGDIVIQKKECVGHVEKRVGARLRNIKKKTKGLGGKQPGKLTNKLIGDLTTYYGLAIRRNKDSEDDMRKAIWATFLHKCSTNMDPQHIYCPEGPNSWCDWQRAKAENKLDSYSHKPPLNEDVQKAIKPIYEDLTNADLLQRCIGGFTQNNNESYHSLIWQIAPKHLYSGAKIVKIASYLAACFFNQGNSTILHMLNTMGVKIGKATKLYVQKKDETRLKAAERKSSSSTKEARTERRIQKAKEQELFEEVEGLLYGPGVAD